MKQISKRKKKKSMGMYRGISTASVMATKQWAWLYVRRL